MSRGKSKFLNLEKKEVEGFIAFRENKKALIKRISKIGKPNSAQIDNVYYVQG